MNKLKEEQKTIIPYLITFGISMFFLLDYIGLIKLIQGNGFLPFMIGFFALFFTIANVGLLVVSVLGILNCLGLLKADGFGKIKFHKLNEWFFIIATGLLVFLFIFDTITAIAYVYYYFNVWLMLEVIITVGIWLLATIYNAKVLNRKTVVPPISFSKKAKKPKEDEKVVLEEKIEIKDKE